MKALIAALALLIAGCATTSVHDAQRADIDAYVSQAKPLLDSGELKRSEYYTTLYNKFSDSTLSDKGFMMQSLAAFIEKSYDLEAGKITQQEFDIFKLKQGADIEAHNEEMRRQRELAEISRPRTVVVPPVYTPPAAKTVQPIRAPTTCNSYRVGDTVQTNCY